MNATVNYKEQSDETLVALTLMRDEAAFEELGRCVSCTQHAMLCFVIARIIPVCVHFPSRLLRSEFGSEEEFSRATKHVNSSERGCGAKFSSINFTPQKI